MTSTANNMEGGHKKGTLVPHGAVQYPCNNYKCCEACNVKFMLREVEFVAIVKNKTSISYFSLGLVKYGDENR